MKYFNYLSAILSLRPNATFIINGEECYENIEWLDEEQTKPTKEEIATEYTRLKVIWDSLQYQFKRAPEYPPVEDYLDAIVKGDQEQIDSYIAACQAVKAKYPK